MIVTIHFEYKLSHSASSSQNFKGDLIMIDFKKLYVTR